MNARGRSHFVASCIGTFELKTGQTVPIAYDLNELAIPTRKAVKAGYKPILATPKGTRPVVGQQSLVARHVNTEAKLREVIDFAASNSAVQPAGSIVSAMENGLEPYVGAFMPGGPTPMVDLMQDPDLSEVLGHFRASSKPNVLIAGQKPPSDHTGLFMKALDRSTAKAAA
jgi:putative intracellular protease/amidase